MTSKVISVLKNPLFWIIGGAAVVFAFANTGPATASSMQEIVDNTVRLYSNGSKNCSMQVINTGENTAFLTARHCVDSGHEISAYLPVFNDESKLVSETYQYLDIIARGNLMDGEDVAVLDTRADFLPFSGVDLATPEQIKALNIGDILTVVGYPSSGWSDDLYISTGQFLGFTESPGARVPGKWIKTSAPVDGGSSGGGLYLMEDGEYYLVSVTSQRDPTSAAPMSYFTDPETIHEFIELAEEVRGVK